MQDWKRYMIPAAVGLVFIACQQDDDPGFGGTGSSVTPPVYDTSSWGSDDTGDTASSDDTVWSDDTGDTGDTGDTSDTGDTGLGITGTGYSVGDVAYNFTAKDQNGDDWTLYDHYGEIIVLGFGNANDGGFQTTSESFLELESEFSSQGVTFALGLERDANDQSPDSADAADWASAYGVSTVLVADSDIQNDWAINETTTIYVIDQEMTIYWVNIGAGYSSEIENKLDAML